MLSTRDRVTELFPKASVVIHDLAIVWVCWQLLHAARYTMLPGEHPLPLWNLNTAIVLAAQGLVFWKVGLYRGLWRFASVPDLLNIFKASFYGLVAIVLGLAYSRFRCDPAVGADGVPVRAVGAAGRAAPAVPRLEGLSDRALGR